MIRFDDQDLESRLEAMGASQPIPVAKSTLARALLLDALRAYEQTGDPECWKRSARPSEDARTGARPGSVDPATQPDPRPAEASQHAADGPDDDAPSAEPPLAQSA